MLSAVEAVDSSLGLDRHAEPDGNGQPIPTPADNDRALAQLAAMMGDAKIK